MDAEKNRWGGIRPPKERVRMVYQEPQSSKGHQLRGWGKSHCKKILILPFCKVCQSLQH